MADHVQNGTPPPRELTFANRVQTWGDPNGKGWQHWPAGMIDKASLALNVQRAFQSYMSAGPKKADWSNKNPSGWKLVSWVLAERIRRKRGNRKAKNRN